jgi:hypothetical protein
MRIEVSVIGAVGAGFEGVEPYLGIEWTPRAKTGGCPMIKKIAPTSGA